MAKKETTKSFVLRVDAETKVVDINSVVTLLVACVLDVAEGKLVNAVLLSYPWATGLPRVLKQVTCAVCHRSA